MQDLAEDNVACRICMDNKDNCVSLFSQDLSKKIMEIAAVQVEKDDGLPDSICTDCENDLEKCYEFRLKVQVADKKFRENIKFSQVDIAECNIKQERYHIDDGNFDNVDENDSVSMDDEHYSEELDVEQPPRSTGEVEPDPLNHVVVVEEKERKIEMAEYTLSQDDAMSEEPQLKTVEEPAVDPLVCMKEETDAEVMDVDSNQPDPFGPSVSVRSIEVLHSWEKKTKPKTNKPCGVENKIKAKVAVTKSSSSTLGITLGKVEQPQDPFFCQVCNVDCGTADLLDEHKSGNKFMCRECTVTFKNHQELEAHFFGHDKLTCHVCFKVFYVHMDLFQHKQTVLACKNSKMIRCKICHNRFKHEENFVKHMQLKHPNDTQAWKCKICNKSIGRLSLLRYHMTNVHTVYEGMECDICHSILLGPDRLKAHIKTRHINKRPSSAKTCPICDKKFKGNFALKYHLDSHDGQENLCNICGAVIKGETKFKKHLTYHNIAVEKVCNICGAVIKGEDNFKVHLRRHNDKSYACSFCNIVFNTRAEKTKHYHEKHEPAPQPVICEICGKEFKTKGILKNHMSVHSDARPHECEVCGRTFKHRAALYTHSRIHTGVKKYCCNQCGKSFRWKQTYDFHMVDHSFANEANNEDKSGETES